MSGAWLYYGLACREYENLVPETWHVVNDADIIPRVGKFVRLYKRPGARVIIDRKGSIVVRPSALELHLRPSAIQHFPCSMGLSTPCIPLCMEYQM